MARQHTYDLTAGKLAKWKDLSLHANKKACKPWAGLVTGEHEKYGVDMDWLDKQTVDGATHFDVSGLEPGDYIKVSGASHSNKKVAYYHVDAVTDDEITVTRVNESDVLEALNGDEDETVAERDDLINRLAQVDDPDVLSDVEQALDNADA